MKRRAFGMLAVCSFLFSVTVAADKKAPPTTSVDSGSFGIIVNGKRVATESFRVEQRSDYSSVSSELKFDDATVKAVQSSELQMLPTGLLKKYTWKETQPGKSQIVVEPQEGQFLVAHVMESLTEPAKDSVHPLSPATSILDDNFFSHMEVLAWKYMALNCRPNAQNQTECKWESQRMPVFVPHQQESMIVQMQFTGLNKMRFNGADGEFRSFKIQSESGDCLLWFDAQNKLVRVLIASNNTEVIRD